MSEKSSAVAGKEVGGMRRESIMWTVPPAKEMSITLTGLRLLSPEVQTIIVPLCMTPPTRCPSVTFVYDVFVRCVSKYWNVGRSAVEGWFPDTTW